jgi:hypothetical protein
LIVITGGVFDNNTTVGYNTQIFASNAVRLGNSSVSSIGGQVGWTSFSDGRIKNNVKENVPGIAFIKALRPVTYNFDLAKENELTGIKNDTSTWKTKYDIEKITFTGFIAQEVAAAAQKINYDFSGVDKTGNIWGLRYGEFVVPLVKAVQEQETIIEDQNKKIDLLQKELTTLMNEMEVIKEKVK